LCRLRERGFAVKLDTNGFSPDVLEECLPHVDYVALDVKTSLEKYARLGAGDTAGFLRTVEILKSGKVAYEFRTTVVPGIVDAEDIPRMCELVKGARMVVLQQFVPSDTLDKRFSAVKPYPPGTIAEFADIMKNYVDRTILRV
jgi:pyruvate formate lyase activating enzyme